MTIRVFQGEREMASDNRRSASSTWSESRRPRAACRVESPLTSTPASSTSPPRTRAPARQQIRIQASDRLSDADIDQMVKDAESSPTRISSGAAAETKNQAESLVHSTEQQLKGMATRSMRRSKRD